MDRFTWISNLNVNSTNCGNQIVSQLGVRLYDGDNKTPYNDGTLTLTSKHLVWRSKQDMQCAMVLELFYIKDTRDIASTFTKSAKIELTLTSVLKGKPSGPMDRSQYGHVKLSFVSGGQPYFMKCLNEALKAFRLSVKLLPDIPSTKASTSGIGGIEKRNKDTNITSEKNISEAFNDLSELMEKAKEMVTLSHSIAKKLSEKQDEVTEDETRKFKSYLLSLGIADPVTKDAAGNEYFCELSKEIANTIENTLKEVGGVMSLSDVYCRINRARGLELVSPEDVYNACQCFSSTSKVMSLHEYDTGVVVVQLKSLLDSTIVKDTVDMVKNAGFLTAESLAQLTNLSLLLARERLLMSEREGSLCRDDNVEGLRFYANLFLTNITAN